MSEISIGERLSSVAKFVRRGATFADIGTDHAYLPVFLLKAGVIERAVCSDINKGPLENARRTAEQMGVSDRVELLLADGASLLLPYSPTDVAICGMGGELIARIIEDAPFLKSSSVRLLLQPMTRQEALREYLNENGFSLVGEDYVTEAGKSYSVIAVEYSGAAPDENLPRVRYGGVCHSAAAAQLEYVTSKLKSKEKALFGILHSGTSDEGLCRDVEYLRWLSAELGKLKSQVN